MSRRPRLPLALRALAHEPSIRPDFELGSGKSIRLVDASPESADIALAPALVGQAHALVPDIPPTSSFTLAPAVDVVPASLVSATFALRRTQLRFSAPGIERTDLFTAESRAVPIPESPTSLPAQPAAALVRHVSPMPLERVGRLVLHECLEALYHASGASDVNDLALVGVYDRVPIGAISGASSTPNGLELRLRPGGGACRGLLVVGRRRASGALVTAEVETQAAPK
jgi:hypothetical protein